MSGKIIGLEGKGANQKVVVELPGGVRYRVGKDGIEGREYKKGFVCVNYHKGKKKYIVKAGNYLGSEGQKVVLNESAVNILEGGKKADIINRFLVGVHATCNTDIRGEHYLAPFSGRFAHRSQMMQGAPGANHNMPPGDRELVQMGIFG